MKLNQKQQEEIFARLPELCYSVLNTTNEIIIVKRGETGYYRTDYAPAKDRKAAEEWCDLLNERLGVTKSQRKGMEVGSMFGFDVLGINPDYYDFCDNAREVIKEVIEETKNKQN